jgi:hypothetical protein
MKMNFELKSNISTKINEGQIEVAISLEDVGNTISNGAPSCNK